MTSPLDVVAIDGPAGAGKSTVARALAKRLGWRHLDTGSLYRATTLYLLEARVPLEDRVAVERALASLSLDLGESGRVFLAGREVTALVRSPEVEARVSQVSAMPVVRARLRQLQRDQARHGPLVAEGRDMTSVVFPDARFKVYVDAAPAERARRRAEDHARQGRLVAIEEILREIATRDALDSSRQDSPLRRVSDALYVDTTYRDVEAIVEDLARLVESAGAGGR